MFTPIYSVFAEEEKKDEGMNTITNNLALLNESSPIEINLDEITPDNPFVCEKTAISTINDTLAIRYSFGG